MENPAKIWVFAGKADFLLVFYIVVMYDFGKEDENEENWSCPYCDSVLRAASC